MIEFWKTLGGKIAEHGLLSWLAPSVVFWASGLGSWIYSSGWPAAKDTFAGVKSLSEPIQVALLGAVLVVISASAWLVDQLEFPALRLLEGYWPESLRFIKRYLSRRHWLRISEKKARWRELYPLVQNASSALKPKEREEYIALDMALMAEPAKEQDCMPTRLGNILRTAERKPGSKYGLDAIICWPRLWMLLPDGVKKDLAEARAALNMKIQLWIWSALFIVWSYWFIWALPIGILAAAVMYKLMLRTALVYGQLLEATYDLHRTALYQALRWPLPENPMDEKSKGKALTAYLWRGSNANMPLFSPPPIPPAGDVHTKH